MSQAVAIHEWVIFFMTYGPALKALFRIKEQMFTSAGESFGQKNIARSEIWPSGGKMPTFGCSTDILRMANNLQ
jgi:hypothetical protein